MKLKISFRRKQDNVSSKGFTLKFKKILISKDKNIPIKSKYFPKKTRKFKKNKKILSFFSEMNVKSTVYLFGLHS